ncbi:MAG: carbohydrate kinase family protein [Alphaproteobacteria bacterium]
MINKQTIVGIGEVLWDKFPEGKHVGGAPANFVFYAKTKDTDSFLISSVGVDDDGNEILEKFKKLNFPSLYIEQTKKYLTGTVDVTVDGYGIPEYIINKNVAWDFVSWSEDLKKLAQKTDAVCFGSLGQRSEISRKTINLFLSETSEFCLKIFDVNLRQNFFNKEILKNSLVHANVLKLNDEELPVIAKIINISGSEKEVCEEIIKKFDLKILALTKGDKGSFLFSKTEMVFHPGFPVSVVDTVGVGDAFTAALAVGLLKKNPLSKIIENANRLASDICARKGAAF